VKSFDLRLCYSAFDVCINFTVKVLFKQKREEQLRGTLDHVQEIRFPKRQRSLRSLVQVQECSSQGDAFLSLFENALSGLNRFSHLRQFTQGGVHEERLALRPERSVAGLVRLRSAVLKFVL
jgi:hypothetical protein